MNKYSKKSSGSASYANGGEIGDRVVDEARGYSPWGASAPAPAPAAAPIVSPSSTGSDPEDMLGSRGAASRDMDGPSASDPETAAPQATAASSDMDGPMNAKGDPVGTKKGTKKVFRPKSTMNQSSGASVGTGAGAGLAAGIKMGSASTNDMDGPASSSSQAHPKPAFGTVQQKRSMASAMAEPTGGDNPGVTTPMPNTLYRVNGGMIGNIAAKGNSGGTQTMKKDALANPMQNALGGGTSNTSSEARSYGKKS